MRGNSPTRAPRPDAELLVSWRVRRLRAAGFPNKVAQTLARDDRYDLHALLDLVADRGCPPELAVRILAPLDSPEPTR
jgi:hypothetical protein